MTFPTNWLSPSTIEAMYDDVANVWKDTKDFNIKLECQNQAKKLEAIYRNLTGENLYAVVASK